VEFTYPKNKNVKVLKGLNLEIEGGKRTAIVG
jgi:ABC-type transport system involved in cytochrome bd biosynthesis fused ATPase/permease subunit